MSAANLPALVAHADWSVAPAKRWLALARLRGDSSYRARRPRPVGELPDFLDGLASEAGPDGAVFLGVDFPIGLPAGYAARAGIDGFLAVLPKLGRGDWQAFFTAAARPEEISPRRPFFPAGPGRKGEFSRQQLLAGLGLADYDLLLRDCDHATPDRPAAAALFWTLGPQQVGKAAIAGWRDLLIPALVSGRDLKIWPFDGPLFDLFAPGRVVVAETYPGEAIGHLGIRLLRPDGRRGSKRMQPDRAAVARDLLDRAADLGVDLDDPLRAAIAEGFGPAPAGEDAFDATLGLLGMINVLRGHRPPGDPDHPVVRRIEGWILGQTAAPDKKGTFSILSTETSAGRLPLDGEN